MYLSGSQSVVGYTTAPASSLNLVEMRIFWPPTKLLNQKLGMGPSSMCLTIPWVILSQDKAWETPNTIWREDDLSMFYELSSCIPPEGVHNKQCCKYGSSSPISIHPKPFKGHMSNYCSCVSLILEEDRNLQYYRLSICITLDPKVLLFSNTLKEMHYRKKKI